MQHCIDTDRYCDLDEEAATLTGLRADVERLMGRLKEMRDSKPQSSTTAGRAAEVQRILLECPELSDREIARRVGVSPQTVGNWRRKLAQQQMPMAAD